MNYKTAFSILGVLCSNWSYAGFELGPAHLESNKPWLVESVDGEAVCSAGLLKVIVGERGVGFAGMSLPLLEKAVLVVDQKQAFEVEPQLIFQTSATYLLSNKLAVKSAILNATTVELVTRNCESNLVGIFSLHGCPKTVRWSFEQPLGACVVVK